MARVFHPMWLGGVLLVLSAPVAAASFLERSGQPAEVTGNTRIDQPLSEEDCFRAIIPGRWQVRERGARAVHLAATGARGEVEIAFRPARELAGLPQKDLVARDAARLQDDHEQLIGRPAHWTETTIMGPSVRWRASWLDDTFSGPTRALSVETFIVPVSREWVLEISFSEEPQGSRDSFIGAFARSLRHVEGTACRQSPI